MKKLAWMLSGDNDTVTAEAAVEGAILGNYEPIMNKPSSEAKPSSPSRWWRRRNPPNSKRACSAA